MGKRKTPEERVAELETKQRMAHPKSTVITMLTGEMPNEARARLAGPRRAVLLVPPIPDVETWAKQTERYQDWLLRRTGDAKREPPTTDEIARAYRAALLGEAIAQ